MLGLVDFVRAARNSARLALRRVHPLAGPVLIGVIWTVALGSVLWITREDDGGRSTADDALAYTERDRVGTRSAERDDGAGSGDDGPGADGVGQAEWTEGAEGPAGDDTDASAGGDTGGQGAGSQDGAGSGPILEAPGGPGPVTPPSSTGTPPSWLPGEPEEPGPGSTTTSTTALPTTGPTTSTTVPPPGLLDVLLGILFP